MKSSNASISRSLAVATVTAALGTCDKYCLKAEQSCWISGRALSRCPVKDWWVWHDNENVTQPEMERLEFVNQYYWFMSVNKTRKGSTLPSCAAQPAGATQTCAQVAVKGEVFRMPSTAEPWLKSNSCLSWIHISCCSWEFPVTDFPRHGCVFVMMFVTAELMGAALMEAQFGTKPALTACKDTSVLSVHCRKGWAIRSWSPG